MIFKNLLHQYFITALLAISGKCLLADTPLIEHNFDFKEVSNLEKILFEPQKNGVKTHAFALYQIDEKTGQAHKILNRMSVEDLNRRHLLWSISKSVTTLIFGAAKKQKLISENDDVHLAFSEDELKCLNEQSLKEFKKLKMSHLIEMNSGLQWKETYEDDPYNSDIVKMLYHVIPQKKSSGLFALCRDFKSRPGHDFYYSSGDTALLTEVMRRKLPANYPWTLFFDPLEIKDAVFERDHVGAFLGSSYLYLRTKDLVKIATLIMQKGKYKNIQIISSEFIEKITSLSSFLKKKDCLQGSHKMTYGGTLWLNAPCPDGRYPFQDVDQDLVMMLGHGGQSVFIFPSRKAFAIRLASDQMHTFDRRQYALAIQRLLESRR